MVASHISQESVIVTSHGIATPQTRLVCTKELLHQRTLQEVYVAKTRRTTNLVGDIKLGASPIWKELIVQAVCALED